ncbi:hypothetical protein Cfor_12611, partial [Coptotermes formosanus]
MSESDFDLCDRVTYLQAERIFELSSNTHNKKFEKLSSRKSTLNHINSNAGTVINISNNVLDEPTLSVLAK